MQIDDFKKCFQNYTPKAMEKFSRYAVLVPLVEQDGNTFLLYEIRSSRLNTQPGEVCFPGGRMEPKESIRSCALRETAEELGITEKYITIISDLDYLTMRNGATLYPVLAQIDPAALLQIKCNPDEVDHYELVSIETLLSSKPEIFHYRSKIVAEPSFPYEEIHSTEEKAWLPSKGDVLVYRHLSIPLWGLTAKITDHLLTSVLKARS